MDTFPRPAGSNVESLELRRLIRRLAALGEPRELAESPEHANPLELDAGALPLLRQVLQLERARQLDAEDPYVPVWAWRAVGWLGNAQDVPLLLDLIVAAAEDDEWAFRELPPLVARHGQAALAPLLAILQNPFLMAQETRPMDAILEAFEILHAGDVLLRGPIRTALRARLLEARYNPPALNAYLCRSLAYMADGHSLAAIKDAYATNFVDERVLSRSQCLENLRQAGMSLETLPLLSSATQGPDQFVGPRNFARLLCASGVGGQYHEHQAFLVGALHAAGPVEVAGLQRELRTDPATRQFQEFASAGQGEFFSWQFQAFWQECAVQWRGRPFALMARLPSRDPELARPLCDDDPLTPAGLREAAENLRSALLGYRDGYEWVARRGSTGAAGRVLDLVNDSAARLEELCNRDDAWLEQNMAALSSLMKEIAEKWLRRQNECFGERAKGLESNVN